MPQRTPTSFLLLALLLLAVSPAHADEGAQLRAALLLQGKLSSRSATRDGAKVTLYLLTIGPTTVEIDTAGVEADALRKARGKYVTFRSPTVPVRPEGSGGYVLDGAATVEVQELAPLVGVVRATTAKRRTTYTVENAEGAWRIASRDARRFKPYVGMQVEVRCYRVTDGRWFALEKIKDVERKLRPGERNPTSGAEAIGTAWKGTLTATEVPKGIPGVKPGDFALAFTTDAALAKTSGRLMRSYDVVGVRVRAFKLRTRRATIELAYSFGQGSYALMLEGTFAEDWRSVRGTWKSGFLGSGTFTLEVAATAPKDP